MPTTRWTRDHLAALVDDPATCTPVLDDAGPTRMLPDIDFSDLWPAREPGGAIARIGGAEVWAGLSAPAQGNPNARHDVARIRLVMRRGGGWIDLGTLFPDGASPGSREWAGSLVFDPDTDRLSAFYTAAGQRGEPSPTFRQRIFGASRACCGRRRRRGRRRTPSGASIANSSWPTASAICLPSRKGASPGSSRRSGTRLFPRP